jgi:hypothetical protein
MGKQKKRVFSGSGYVIALVGRAAHCICEDERISMELQPAPCASRTKGRVFWAKRLKYWLGGKDISLEWTGPRAILLAVLAACALSDVHATD